MSSRQERGVSVGRLAHAQFYPGDYQMNIERLRLCSVVVVASFFLAGVLDATAQSSDRNFKNVRGANATLLIGTVCSGTFEVPGSRSDRDHGAFKIEFFEADDLLRVSHSSKLGYVAYRDFLNGKGVFESSGPAPTLQVEGNKMTFVTGLGSKWDIVIRDGGTLVGSADPRGMPGRRNWEVANVDGKCTAGFHSAERSK
ncbi:MAG: hypothetical protein ACXWCY_18315 [Burkholderiales bacterium]